MDRREANVFVFTHILSLQLYFTAGGAGAGEIRTSRDIRIRPFTLRFCGPWVGGRAVVDDSPIFQLNRHIVDCLYFLTLLLNILSVSSSTTHLWNQSHIPIARARGDYKLGVRETRYDSASQR